MLQYIRFVAMFCLFLLCGCASLVNTSQQRESPYLSPLKLDTASVLPEEFSQSQVGQLVKSGLEQLDQGNYQLAGQAFQAALRLKPQNSYLHFFNGLVYHLQAKQGAEEYYELAELGYQYAQELENSNWLAVYQLGRLWFEKRNYRAAQDAFSRVILLEPEYAAAYHDLAVASYYAGDIVIASSAIKEAYKKSAGSPSVGRAASVILAASNDSTGIQKILSQHDYLSLVQGELGTNAKAAVERWQNLHAKASEQQPEPDEDIVEEDESLEYEPEDEPADVFYSDEETDRGSDADRMIMVEVVILKTEDTLSTSKGSNLLRLLTVGYDVTDTNASNVTYDAYVPATDSSRITKDLTKIFTIKALNYNLNIANAGDAKSDIIARPTLLVCDGVESEFSLVEEQQFTVRGQEAGSLESIQAGIRIVITPEFIGENLFKLDMIGEASAFQPSAAVVGSFQEAVKIIKAQTRTSAVLTFDQTVIISGFNQRATSNTSSGVPFLKDIPGVQYAFSEDVTSDKQTSFLVLITPRKPETATIQQSNQPQKLSSDAKTKFVGSPNLEALLREQKSVFGQVPMSIKIVAEHLSRSSEFYRQFRTGDLMLDRWDNSATLTNLVKQGLSFLYF